MKKLLIAIMLLAGVSSAALARNEYAHDASVLPAAAQTVIKNNFKSTVSVVKIDKDFGRVSEYDVSLSDGSEISFDRQGNWKEVETNVNVAVPGAFIPQPVAAYIAKNHKGQKVVGIEKERSGYDVTLSNGIELKFNKNGGFVRYD